MSTYEVMTRFGTGALLRFLGLVSVFVCLHLVRVPFVAIAAGLDGLMRRVDSAATARVSTPHPGARDESTDGNTRPGGQSRQEQNHRAGVSGTQQGTGEPRW